MENFIKIQDDNQANLRKTISNFKKTPKSRLSKNYIKVRLENLEKHWNIFNEIHREIVKQSTAEQKKTHEYFKEDIFLTYEEEYLDCKADMLEILDSCQVENNNNESQQTEVKINNGSQVKLPKINIPIFKGDYTEWVNFKDLYVSLIHNNNSINNVQKLHYLKSCVSGEPEQLLKNINITEKNYDMAWTTLQQRYNHRRIIVNAILNRLFGQKKLQTETARGLKELLDTTIECLNSLKNNEIAIDNWDPIIIYIIVNKLDQESHKLWEEDLQNLPVEELPRIERFTKFLEGRFRVTEMLQTPHIKEKAAIKSKSFATTSKNYNNSNSEQSKQNIECRYCKRNHYLSDCDEYANLDPLKKNEYVQNEKLCFNCLRPGHSVRFCRLRLRCNICKRKHNTLLHSDKLNFEKQDTETEVKTAKEPLTQNVLSHVSTSARGRVSLLATALINIETSRGPQIVRALIDPCSEESFISDAVVKKFQIRRIEKSGQISAVGQMSTPFNHAAEIMLTSRVNKEFKIKCTAYVVKKVTDIIPAARVDYERWTHFDGIELADPTFHTPGEIDLLLGVNVYAEILLDGIVRRNRGEPIAQQTSFGWIISGGDSIERIPSNGHVISMHLSVSLDNMLQRFWECESLEIETKNKLTLAEARAEEIYEKTVTRNEEGRYIVSLPFVRDDPVLPENSKAIALRRFKCLEKKLCANKDLKREYDKVLREYITLNHMKLVTCDINKITVHLPHHAIVRNDRQTTKVRVVFDASCRGSNGVSLNDELLIGPRLQEELRDLILRWRTHKICFVGDLVKMYRQILITEKDTDCQRILYRFNADEEIQTYKLLTVTFGTAAAPYLAIRTLKQLATDEGERYPWAKNIVLKDFYVDDVLTGFDNVSSATEAFKQLSDMLLSGGFELQKIHSNSKDFMLSVESEKRAKDIELNIDQKETIKTLGILWETSEDILKIAQIQLEKDNTYDPKILTKRNVLRKIASLFDPLGWISPAIIIAKVFMQKLWSRKIDWDDQLPDDLKEEWHKYKDDLPILKSVQIPRWIGSTTDQEVELHGFADASQVGYAAVVYTKVWCADNNAFTMTLIISKTKVAPIKKISIPRLELCAATLLSKLLKHVSTVLSIRHNKTFAWSDSKVVLAWIKGDPERWTPFVKNRVIEIRNNLESQWYYVKSKENPADLASRGVLPTKLKESDLWWHGPEFLQKQELTERQEIIPDTELEMKVNMKCKLTNVRINRENDILTRLKKYSSLKKLLDVVALMYRWLKILKKEKIDCKIDNNDREKALTVCIKMTQAVDFAEEIDCLKKYKNIKRNSRLLPLHPYLDENEVLRVGGRLKHANLDHDRKYPIILTKDSALIPLLLDEAHKATMHGGPRLMSAYLQNKYWIINGGQTIKRFYRQCFKCMRHNATANNQLMGNLPEVRVKPSRPFSISGVDFAGPILCRMSKGRGAKSYKAYICLFICMATKAIHIELVSDMTTEAFIASFKRFVARRGRCFELWSDHGTTFISAEKTLFEMWKQGKNALPEELKSMLDDRGTTWKYIPPGAPNFGGLWEAGVKSVKYHLKRIVGNATLTFEELYTVLTQIEACLNSRPLTALDDNYEYITPGHFLVGEPTITLPERDYKEVNLSSLSRWQLTQRMVRDFWNKWQTEYLSRLQQRPKWMRPQKDFEIGDLVLIKDSRLPPACWKLGRISQKFTGSDGLTRMYDIRTATGMMQRAVSKLCALPNEKPSL